MNTLFPQEKEWFCPKYTLNCSNISFHQLKYPPWFFKIWFFFKMILGQKCCFDIGEGKHSPPHFSLLEGAFFKIKITSLGQTYQQYFDSRTLFKYWNSTKGFHWCFKMDPLKSSHDKALPKGKIKVASSKLCRLKGFNEDRKRIECKM